MHHINMHGDEPEVLKARGYATFLIPVHNFMGNPQAGQSVKCKVYIKEIISDDYDGGTRTSVQTRAPSEDFMAEIVHITYAHPGLKEGWILMTLKPAP